MLNFQQTYKHVFTILSSLHTDVTQDAEIPWHEWQGAYLFYIVNIMCADNLVAQGARTSATKVLTMLTRNNSFPARQVLMTCIRQLIVILFHVKIW